ncbi:calcium sensing receptor, chloroplastic isoform X2 [Rhododendron vialii]|uniref:calcium sensing receptor, chloroplastic isoform X2 n=1 Tax=Rhododendron vialii TaxID=182163 RepID=UPI00265F04A0|nr:calcium sensing receptor, chloroplastic isoform X2 [Rhododendron vialii]
MRMLPVCSATTSCSQISLHGGLQHLPSLRKACEVRCSAEGRVVLDLSSGNHIQGVSLKTEAASLFRSSFVDGREQSGSTCLINMPPFKNELGDSNSEYFGNWSYKMSGINAPHYVGMEDLKFVASSSVSDSLTVDTDALSSGKTDIQGTLDGVSMSISSSVNKGEIALEKSVDVVTSSITSALKGANEGLDSALSEVISSIDHVGEFADKKFTSFSNDLKEASKKVGAISVEFLRGAIVQIEDSLKQGATYVVSAYGSTKDLLPSEVQNILSLSEDRVTKVLRPVGTALQQIYMGLEVFEKSLGLDPNDPIVTFVLFIGTSATLWGSYWFFTYGGYAGDLSPKSTFELLSGNENVVLIDVRPEDLRERDGIPDLRRSARFRYGNVTLPEVDGSVRKLLKSGKDLDDTLTAAVIRNLKIIQDRSKVVILDADGTRSKGIARSLKKLGVKRPYLVQGGFQSWVKDGLRIKELKPETTLTIINEGFIAAAYALLEWEKTLQLVGVIGLGQTIYRRIASYEDVDDFKQDVSQLLAPVRLGGQAISWVAGKLETNGMGLPTSPSSSDVQSRVLQAAAKHESQPSDGKENQDSSPDLTTENIDLSEA